LIKISWEGVPDGLLVVLGVVVYEGQLDVVRLQDIDGQEACHAVASDQTKYSCINFIVLVIHFLNGLVRNV
jgi:hypothetical protein